MDSLLKTLTLQNWLVIMTFIWQYRQCLRMGTLCTLLETCESLLTLLTANLKLATAIQDLGLMHGRYRRVQWMHNSWLVGSLQERSDSRISSYNDCVFSVQVISIPLRQNLILI